MNEMSPKADALAQRLAAITGEDVKTVVEHALEKELAQVAPRPPLDADALAKRNAAFKKFFDTVGALPVLDGRDPDDIIGYGPDGLPS